MSEIIVGDSGTIIEMTISDDVGVIDIRGASIDVTLKSSTKRIVKQAVVTNGELGLCQIILDSQDVQDIGNVVFQATITFPSGNKFSSSLGKFKVAAKL